jgi:hypothetical protein
MRGQSRDFETVKFGVAFDEQRYKRLSGSRLRDPSAFSVTNWVDIRNNRYEMPYSDGYGIVDLKKNYSLKLPTDVVDALDRVLNDRIDDIGTVGMDCAEFITSLATSISSASTPIKDWQSHRQLNRSSLAIGAFVRMRRMNFCDDSIDQYDASHWFMSLEARKNPKVIHIAGQAGRLMVSDLSTVNAIYPHCIHEIVTPKQS